MESGSARKSTRATPTREIGAIYRGVLKIVTVGQKDVETVTETIRAVRATAIKRHTVYHNCP